jgi:hypothetical protein
MESAEGDDAGGNGHGKKEPPDTQSYGWSYGALADKCEKETCNSRRFDDESNSLFDGSLILPGFQALSPPSDYEELGEIPSFDMEGTLNDFSLNLPIGSDDVLETTEFALDQAEPQFSSLDRGPNSLENPEDPNLEYSDQNLGENEMPAQSPDTNFKCAEQVPSQDCLKCSTYVLSQFNPIMEPVRETSCISISAPQDYSISETEIGPEKAREGAISAEERRKKIAKYIEKKKRRCFKKKVVYQGKSKKAFGRIRLQGKFVNGNKLRGHIYQNASQILANSRVCSVLELVDFPLIEKPIFEFAKVRFDAIHSHYHQQC